MKRRLKKKEYVFVASMLFGLVFGAGNLIFPAAMGQRAGAAMLPALIGFCTTGVGLPLLAIAAISITASESLFDICAKVGRRFSYAFTCLLYLSIGPLFAIPRTATVSFQIGISPFVSAGTGSWSFHIYFQLLHHCPLFLPAPLRHPHLGRQSAHPALSALPQHSDRHSSAGSDGQRMGCTAGGTICRACLLHRIS